MEEIPVEMPSVSPDEGQVQAGPIPEEAVPLAGIQNQDGHDAASPLAPEMPNSPQGTTPFPGGQSTPGGTTPGIWNDHGRDGQPFGSSGTPGSGIIEDIPEILTMGDLTSSGGAAPVVMGNIPGNRGKGYGDSGMPGSGMFGDMPEMPTSGGPSTSGGGPPV